VDGHTLNTGLTAENRMATTPTKPTLEVEAGLAAAGMTSWLLERNGFAPAQGFPDGAFREVRESRPSGRDALQALLAFSAMHQQVRQRRALASRHNGFDKTPGAAEFEPPEQFVLDEVLQLVAERAIAITGADGLGIALAENNEIVLRASAGTIKPDVGARIQRDSAFSGACFRTAQIIRCDDTETDDRVNLYACRQLGARSMVAVPLCGRRRVIGLLEAFSVEPFGFSWLAAISLRKPRLMTVGFPWISLDSLVRIEPYQWVTRDFRWKIFPRPLSPTFASRRKYSSH